jgi:hypothetical protein
MKLAYLLALASATVVTAHAGGLPSSYYKVKISADATLQTAPDKTKKAKVTTNDVIEALIDQLGVPSSSPSQFDIIACFTGNNDQIMESATYYLARTRGPADFRYKVLIPEAVFDTEGGQSVFKRVFTANSSTVKVNVTDSFSSIELNTSMLTISAQGLANAQVTVKDFSLLGDPYLSLVKNRFEGHHVIETGDGTDGVGTINASIEGAVKTEDFNELQTLGVPF